METHAGKLKRKSKVFIIAEAGVNHNGSLRIAKKLIYAAADAGSDAVKFQLFDTAAMAAVHAPKAAYQKKAGKTQETQYRLLKRLELDAQCIAELMRCCVRKKIVFIASAFDLKSIDVLNRLGLKIFKIPSGEITNLPYLRRLGSLKKKIILSTGMSNMREISRALQILLKAGTKKDNITVLHCNSEYPSPFQDVNLLAMLKIKDKFKVAVGYSDHTLGIELAPAATALGASVIEKHFTLDKDMQGSDHQASLEPDEFKSMVQAVRNIEVALGDGAKGCSPSEARNINLVRKSIVATRDIKKGERFREENIAAKRPAKGISPMKWDTVLGKIAKRDFKRDETIAL